MAKRKRRRATRQAVRENAKSKGGGSGNWLALPDGIRVWTPEKKGIYLIDIVPYEVKENKHPDAPAEKDVLWYKRPYAIHHGIGEEDASVVCPKSVNKPCPMCEEKKRLAEDWDTNEQAIRDIGPQKFTAYNILDPDDNDKIAIFAFSNGKFATPLEKELDEGEEDILGFFDVTEDGKTLKVRFSEKEFNGTAYLEATRIDFKDRDEMDEDKILERTVELGSIFNVLTYENLKSMWQNLGEVDGEESVTEDDIEEEQVEEEEKPRRKRKPTSKKVEEEENEEKEESFVEPPMDEPKKEKPKEKPSPKKKGQPTCPVENGTFGKDLDTFDECDDCPHWDACEESSD